MRLAGIGTAALVDLDGAGEVVHTVDMAMACLVVDSTCLAAYQHALEDTGCQGVARLVEHWEEVPPCLLAKVVTYSVTCLAGVVECSVWAHSAERDGLHPAGVCLAAVGSPGPEPVEDHSAGECCAERAVEERAGKENLAVDLAGELLAVWYSVGHVPAAQHSA